MKASKIKIWPDGMKFIECACGCGTNFEDGDDKIQCMGCPQLFILKDGKYVETMFD